MNTLQDAWIIFRRIFPRFKYLNNADKSDPDNEMRVLLIHYGRSVYPVLIVRWYAKPWKGPIEARIDRSYKPRLK